MNLWIIILETMWGRRGASLTYYDVLPYNIILSMQYQDLGYNQCQLWSTP